MLGFLGPQLATALVALLVFAPVALILGRAVYTRRHGHSGGCRCGGCAGCSGCGACPHAGACHPAPHTR